MSWVFLLKTSFALILSLILSACAESKKSEPASLAPAPAYEDVTDYSACNGSKVDGVHINSGVWKKHTRHKYFDETTRMTFSGRRLRIDSTCSWQQGSVTVSVEVGIFLSEKHFEVRESRESRTSFQQGICGVSRHPAIFQYKIRGKCLELSDITGTSSTMLVLEETPRSLNTIDGFGFFYTNSW